MATGHNGLTYADAGVDIDAGNALVDRIKPAAKATSRPGVMGGLGGFGALFDLKAVVHSQRLRYAAQMRNRSQVFAALDLIRVPTPTSSPHRTEPFHGPHHR